MKKLLALILMAALCLGLLAGCGEPAASDTSEPPATDAGGEENPSGGNAATELTVWLPVYQFGDGISDEDFWNEKFDAFEAENNCTIKVEIQGWTDYATNIYTGLLSAEGPDVVYVTEYYDIITSELIVPLDAYLTEEDYDLYLYLTQGAYNSNGELCTFPMMPGNPCVMYFNMDMLEAAGVTELPTTWDEFYEVCLKLKEANPDVMPFTSSWGASNGVSALLTSFWPFFRPSTSSRSSATPTSSTRAPSPWTTRAASS